MGGHVAWFRPQSQDDRSAFYDHYHGLFKDESTRESYERTVSALASLRDRIAHDTNLTSAEREVRLLTLDQGLREIRVAFGTEVRRPE